MKKILSLIILFCSCFIAIEYNSAHASFFNDVNEEHPYYQAISYLQNHGIIEGYSDQTFRPDQKINRAETLKILLLGSNIDIKENIDSGGFFDIPTESWFAPYVLKAKQLGIVQGNPDGSFAPERTVNLAESVKMIINTNSFSIEKNINENPYKDVPQDSWYGPYFDYGKKGRFFTIKGHEDIFPNQEMTRGYLASLMYRAILHKKMVGREREYASFYSDKFNGRTTASGTIFSNDDLTAAHKTLPFGTKVRAININNGRSVIVTITDRGPYAPNRVLDLTTRSFEKIGPLSSGILPIVYEVIDENGTSSLAAAKSCEQLNDKSNIKKDFYQNVILENDIPNVYLKNEIYNIKGKLTNDINESSITASLFEGDNQIQTFNVQVKEDKSFEIPLFLEQSGTFNIALIPGVSGSSKIHQIYVEESECNINNFSKTASEPNEIQFTIIDNIAKVRWLHEDQLTKIRFSDGDKEEIFYLNNSQKELDIPYARFDSFSEGTAYVEVAAASSSSIFSVDRDSAWNYADKIPLTLTKHHFGEYKKESIHVSSFSYSHFPQGTISLKAEAKTNILPNAVIILPNGFVTEIPLAGDKPLSEDNVTKSTYFPKGTNVTLSYPTETSGTYVVGIYNDSGEAIFNYPSYDTNEKPILPDFLDLNKRQFEPLDYASDKQALFTMINEDRKNLGLGELEIYDNLNELAQSRSDDMVKRDYFGHITPNGTDVNVIRVLYDIKTPLKENIAKDVSVEFTHALLMRSPKHRSALLDPRVTRVGIGIAEHEDGTIIVTELFSEEPIEPSQLPTLREDLLNDINKQRLENDIDELTLSGILTPVAQQWSDGMAENNFCEGESHDEISINDEIEKNGGNLSGGLSRFICNTSYDDAIKAIKNHESIISEEFETIGIGISQDPYGIIRFTIISAHSN
jgi:rare lipoprotein A